MPTLTQLQEFESVNAAVAANEEGYDACYDGVDADANPYNEDHVNSADWNKGWNTAEREIEQDCAMWDDARLVITL